jgi:hypothetical protein
MSFPPEKKRDLLTRVRGYEQSRSSGIQQETLPSLPIDWNRLYHTLETVPT